MKPEDLQRVEIGSQVIIEAEVVAINLDDYPPTLSVIIPIAQMTSLARRQQMLAMLRMFARDVEMRR